MGRQKKTAIRQKIRNTLRQLGMQAKAKDVVDALAQYGLTVSEGFVERVRFEEMKGRKRVEHLAGTFNRVGNRHQPQKRPW